MQFIADSYYIDLGINLFSCTIALMTFGMLLIGYHNEFKGNGYLVLLAAVNLVFNLDYLGALFLLGKTGQPTNIILNVIYLGQLILPCLLYFSMIMYTVNIIEEDGVRLSWKPALGLFFLAEILIIIVNFIYPFIYYIDMNDLYKRQSAFLLNGLMELVSVLLLLIIMRIYQDRISDRQIQVILIYIMAPVMAVIVSMLTDKVDLIALLTSISVLLMGIIAQKEQMIRFQQHEEEMEEIRTNLMISQLRPHFLYNALSSISQLCKVNPLQASQMTDRFSEFLSKNMKDLQRSEPVSFEKELEYIKNYIAIEKMRFGDDLEVDYQIETVDFMVPPLVVQPILENSIKHGLGGKEEGGKISIAARKVNESSIITISDDGVGYDPNKILEKKDGRVHVGMASVQQRLKEIRGAQYITKSSPGKGTTVMVIIPDSYNEDYYQAQESVTI